MGRLVWWGCACLAVGLGTLCLLAWWGWSAAVVFVALGALVAAVVASAVWSGDDVPGAARKIVKTTGAGALLGPAIAGLIAAFGSSGLLIVLVLAATTPALTAWVHTRWFTPDPPPIQATDEQPAPPTQPLDPQPTDPQPPAADPAEARAVQDQQPELRRLDDESLCLAWRRSFFQLEAASTAGERLSVVEQRQRYLDELHRRSPRGLAAWFASGARASGDPLPYVGETHRRIE